MITVFTLSIFIATLYDVRLLRRLNPSAYQEFFRWPAWYTITMLALFFMIIIFAHNPGDMAGAFTLLFILPMYLNRRDHFLKKNLSLLNLEMNPTTFRKHILLIDMLGVILWWFYSIAVLSIVTESLAESFSDPSLRLMGLLLTTLGSSLIAFSMIYRRIRKKHRDHWSYLGLRREKRSFWIIAVAPAVVGIILAVVSVSFLTARETQPQTPLSEILEATQAKWILGFFVLMAVFFAPLMEEIIFRGYFFATIKKVRGTFWALIITGASFGLLHMSQYWEDWLAIIFIIFLGLILTFIRAVTGSTIASTVTHYFYNTGVIILPLLILSAQNPSYLEYKVSYPQLSYEKKEELLQLSISKQPELAEIYNELAWLYAEKGEKLEQGLILIEKALALEPEEIAYLDTQAEILFKLNRYTEAKTIWMDLLDHRNDEIPEELLMRFEERLEDIDRAE